METFEVRNVHAALPEVLDAVIHQGVRRNSRNGEVLVFPHPITVVYRKPMERVIFWPERDANPFFHLMEAIWMLSGHCDTAFPASFAHQISQYSDDGVYLHGAYGFRWRQAFEMDQLQRVVDALKRDHDNRRQVIQMWDAEWDLGKESKDLPCNLAATVQINTEGALDLHVFQRSGDILWGILGANAVHFSVLQEYLAGCIRVPVGRYYQICTNAHVYINEQLEHCKPILLAVPDPLRQHQSNPYDFMIPFNMFTNTQTASNFDHDLGLFFRRWEGDFESQREEYETFFFDCVVGPMYQAHRTYKASMGNVRYSAALYALEDVRAADWRLAAEEWVRRRQKKFEQKGKQ